MRLFRLVSIAALTLTLAPAVAFAQSNSEPLTYDERFANQQNRIGAGVQDGSLNPYEASRLERGEQRIQNMDNRFMSDGSLSPAEQQRLNRAQNVESQRIYNQRHDAQRADGHVGPWEHRRINQAYAGESRRIFRQRHDGQQR